MVIPIFILWLRLVSVFEAAYRAFHYHNSCKYTMLLHILHADFQIHADKADNLNCITAVIIAY